MTLVNHARRAYARSLGDGLANDEGEIDLIRDKVGDIDDGVNFNLADIYFINSVIRDMLRAGNNIKAVVGNHLVEDLNLAFMADGGDFYNPGGNEFLRGCVENRRYFVNKFHDFFQTTIPVDNNN